MEMRTCRICSEVKPLDKFEKDSRYEGLYTTRCRSCKFKTQDRAIRAYHKLQERAAKTGNKVEVSLDEVKAMFNAFDGICIYCGAQEDPNGSTFHVDHVVARSQGGADHINNLVIACPTCNCKKNNKPVVSYFFDDDRFKDENFSVLIQYLALSAGKSVSAMLEKLVNDYAISELRKMREDLRK